MINVEHNLEFSATRFVRRFNCLAGIVALIEVVMFVAYSVHHLGVL